MVYVQEEAGQLFRDIAIAVSCAVGLSMLVAITVIPALSAKILGAACPATGRFGPRNLFGVGLLAGYARDWVCGLVYWLTGGFWRRLALVITFTAAALAGSYYLAPKVEYLPTGNANFLFGRVTLASGYSVKEAEDLQDLYSRVLPPILPDTALAAPDLPGGGLRTPFFVAFGNGIFLGAAAKDPLRVRELIPIYQGATRRIPSARGGFRQTSIFERGRGAGAINLDITGPDLERLRAIGLQVIARMRKELPDAQSLPMFTMDHGKPELRIVPHRLRCAELMVPSQDLGFAVNALVDGAKVSRLPQWDGQGRSTSMLKGGRPGDASIARPGCWRQIPLEHARAASWSRWARWPRIQMTDRRPDPGQCTTTGIARRSGCW